MELKMAEEVRYNIMHIAKSIALYQFFKVQGAMTNAGQWGDYVYQTLYKTEQGKRALQSPWNHPREENGITIESVAGHGCVGFSGKEEAIKTFFSRPRICADLLPIGDLAGVMKRTSTDGYPIRLILLDHPAWYGLRDELIAYNTAMRAAAAERDAFMEGVSKICDYYATVNEALAAWPALRFLLSGHRQGQDFPFDGTPKPLPDGVDIAELTAMVTRAKLEV